MSFQSFGAIWVNWSLAELVEQEILPGTGISSEDFWSLYARILEKLGPHNQALLARRDAIHLQIDDWHRGQRGRDVDPGAYRSFLEEIGYIVPQGEVFEITSANVDAEVATMAGPQLVVPVMNARFSLNAANARWGGLYDALYGADAISRKGALAPGGTYNPHRGQTVVARAAANLDQFIPIAGGSHGDVESYGLGEAGFVVTIAGQTLPLGDPAQYRGRREEEGRLVYLFVHNELHLELVIDRTHPIGKVSVSGLADVVLEAALTTKTAV